MVGIGFFAPLPLAMMMPFMAGQSMLMGDAFGKAYQYGKRKISAMSNEEFNALTPEMLGQSIVADYNAIIPSLEQAVKSSSEFQSIIIQEMGNVLKSIPNEILKFFGLEGFNEGETVDGLISVSLAIIKSWSLQTLRIAFEQNFETYTLLTKANIKSEYDRRVTGTEPTPIPTPEPEPTPGVSLTEADASVLAQGNVFLVTGTDTWKLRSRISGEWVQLKSGTLSAMVILANASWPTISYEVLSFARSPSTSTTHLYWILKTKL